MSDRRSTFRTVSGTRTSRWPELVPDPPPRRPPRLRLNRSAAVSGMLAVAALFGGLRLEPWRGPLAHRRPDAEPARLDLVNARGEAALPLLTLPADAHWARVSFLLSGSAGDATVRIEDQTGRVVVAPIPAPRPDAGGRAWMVVPAEPLRSSSGLQTYSVVVAWPRPDDAGPAATGEVRFPFRIQTDEPQASAR